jgi:hypothetical protein
MVQFGTPGAGLPLILSTALSIACSGCGANSSPNRVLLSMSITPAVADAATSASRQVQFTATGTFSRPPSPDAVPFVAPYSGSWLVSNPKAATITQTGLASCPPGGSGIVTVTAVASANSAGPGAMSTAVSGTAKLTCP